MKINKILNLIIVSMLLFTVSCEPIVDSEDLTNTTNVEGVELVALQSTPGGNGITLQMKTPGVTGWWDFNIGRAYSDEASFNYPIPGMQTYTFTGTLGAEFFTKTIDVQIDVLDQPLNQDWYDLVSTDTSTGKTWVFEAETPWYMAPQFGQPDSYGTIWWPAWECCLADSNGKMVSGAAFQRTNNHSNNHPRDLHVKMPNGIQSRAVLRAEMYMGMCFSFSS